jgi:hypothetical protein
MVSTYHFTPVSETRCAPPASAWGVELPEGAALSAYDAGYLEARAVFSPEVAETAWVWKAPRPGETPAALAGRRRRGTPRFVVLHPSPGAPVSRPFFRTVRGKGPADRIETGRGLARETGPSRCRRRGVAEATGGPPGGTRAIGIGPAHRARGEGDR